MEPTRHDESAWEGYKAADGDAARQSADDFLAETRRLEEDFPDTPPPPRCDLPEGASIDALAALAYFHGEDLLESLRRFVQDAGGEYKRGPRKSKSRIRQKTEKDYGGDVARVVDLERATGIFDSVDDLSFAISLLRDASRRGEITIRRCKDRFSHPFENGYRDLQLNVELEGFVGELQLNLRRIIEVKAKAHKIYEVERVIEAKEDKDALQRAVDGPGLESEQVLRLTIEGGRSIDDAFGSLAVFEAALARALPPGCVVANVYSGERGEVRVRLGLDEVAAMAQLRDDVVLESRAFEDALNESLPDGTKISVDRAAFLECYSRIMMRFGKLTPHQREKLKELRAANVAVLLSPAGGGKTFLAIQRVLEELRGDAGAVVLFAARNVALALFVCKWLVVASRKSAKHVVDRVHVLVAPFEDGPRRVRVEGRRLVLDAVGEAVKYALVVVDEAHHLVNDAALRAQLAHISAAQTRLLLLADASQATATHKPDQIARSLVDLPHEQKVAVATLSEVVRSTKRIVAGAAAFQLEAGRKAETETHAASIGPPLVARIFKLADGQDTSEHYAPEVVEALSAVQKQLTDLSDLDDRVAVVCPDEVFVEKLRGPLGLALGGFELVDAATASAALPRDEERSSGSKPWLVVDSVDNMDGLERLVVICVGLDQVIDRGAGVFETRSRLYRAMTRAQLAVAVVNEVLPGGWLEFLGRVELDDKKFDDAKERRNRAETAADDVVGGVVEEASAPVRDSVDADKGAVEKASPEDTGAPAEAPMPADKEAMRRGGTLPPYAEPDRGLVQFDAWRERIAAEEEGVAEELVRAVEEEAVAVPSPEKKGATEVVDADAATTPSEAEPMKVLQSIWDASAVATVARGDLRFMPFSDPLSKLVELRTLRGHSHGVRFVRCGVHCAFVLMCLRRRSGALRCFRTGGASFLVQEPK
ncbi:unnamed protein product [Pelagomonas calceolata]|uniref:Helicase ATP-binding domain-containing protein n=1 Tax=Pelagomonas calceolata TaxID=35677 RepID=A0A8J2SAI1_9STRA|nr:unnamed protein product [Pelagomonas calceolata]